MTDFFHRLVEQYGLIAVFFGCIAEGESAAIFGGFLSHQSLFNPLSTWAAAFAGAWLGDTGMFFAGRHFANNPRILAIRSHPGFKQAYDMIQRHPYLFVLTNRFMYGLRTVGGVAAGLASIPSALFITLNAVSAAVWAALFVAIGYFFGATAEQLLGHELVKHERLLIGLGLSLLIAALGLWFGHHRNKKRQ